MIQRTFDPPPEGPGVRVKRGFAIAAAPSLLP